MKSTKIKLAVLDNHTIVREGIKHLCASTSDISTSLAASIEDGLAHDLTRHHIILMDIASPSKDGIHLLKQLKNQYPELKILIFSMYSEDQYGRRCLKAGASGFLNKEASSQELIKAIRLVASGRKYISTTLAEELASSIGEDPEAPLHTKLSDREYQIMIMIAGGNSVSDIASELSLSVKTISMFRSRALQKMKLRHNSELTHYVLSNNLA
ncbi:MULTISPECIES: response regulator [Herbaspirillum]|uniref:DNA-binding response regulator n=1 Tax=Herbaspirillum rubrisubalbicans Os34 TaxID=1235827 RepID=A0A6M3ZMN5_9BURK|nr:MULTISPECIES: response regulator transcription factor [Herbaspirillum]QJP99834.1 DNA-binding response regulator [Herbaspirillum rubrisubalbicans Os34]